MQTIKNPKVNDKVFGLVYGKGIITSVYEDSHYLFEVTYDNGQTVPYHKGGIPGWSGKLDFKTVFHEDEIKITEIDFSPTNKKLETQEIIKLREIGELEMRCPSGVWQPTEKIPTSEVEDALEANQLHLFRNQKRGE